MIKNNKNNCKSDNYKINDNVASKATFIRYAEQTNEELETIGSYGTVRNRRQAIRRFKKFLGNQDFFASELTPEMLVKFELTLKSEGLCRNTTSFYMRTLRTIYNQARQQGLADDPKLFSRVYTGIDKTAKRAVRIDIIRKISQMRVDIWRSLEFSRDLFMFSFYTRGMSFVDMAFLRKNDLNGGILTYRRHKTGQLISIKWEPEMDAIVKRHPSDNDFLLPIIKGKGNEQRKYRNALTVNNRRLKRICSMLNLSTSISYYTARHSWATIAQQKNIPLSVISRALGHSSERNTRIYLDSIQSEQVDEANLKIIRSL